MPAATSKKRPARPSRDELLEQNQIDEEMLEPGDWEQDWKTQCQEYAVDAWERLSFLPKEHLSELHVYLYRKEPRVYNAPKDGHNIAKYYDPLPTKDAVQREHGGGLFRIILKRGRRTLGDWVEALEGRPIYKEGQVDAAGNLIAPGNGTGTVVQQSNANSAAEIIRATKELLQPDKGLDKTVDMMTTGFTAVMKAATDNNGQKPNPLMDKLLEKALDSDPVATFTAMANALRVLQPPTPPPVIQNPESRGFTVSGLMEELKPFGIESFADLFRKNSGGPAEKSMWEFLAPVLVNVSQNIPALLGGLRAFAEDNFRRDLIRIQFQNALAKQDKTQSPDEVLKSVLGTQPAIQQPTQPAEVISPGQSSQSPEDVAKQAVAQILKYFHERMHGGICAGHLQVDLPLAVQQLGPALSDRAQLDAVVANIPPLAEIAKAQPVEWKLFLDQFAEYFQENREDPTAEPGSETEEPEAGEPEPVKPN